MRRLPGFSKYVLFLVVPDSQQVKNTNTIKRNTVLIIAEILVMGGILTAFVAPLLFPSDESSEVR
jgi:hypothetical protein